jgi:hypothetical protein
MPTYGSGNNKEYLIHVIFVLRLVEQKGTAAEVKEAFAGLVTVRKAMSPQFPQRRDHDQERSKKEEAQQTKRVPQGQEIHCG